MSQTATKPIEVTLELNSCFVRNWSACDFCGTEFCWKETDWWGQFAHPDHDEPGTEPRRGSGDVCQECMLAGAVTALATARSRTALARVSPPRDDGSLLAAERLERHYASVRTARAALRLTEFDFIFPTREQISEAQETLKREWEEAERAWQAEP